MTSDKKGENPQSQTVPASSATCAASTFGLPENVPKIGLTTNTNQPTLVRGRLSTANTNVTKIPAGI